YGYTAFSYNLTEFLNPAGEENILVVQVKNEGENSRWYSGSGIYRNVTLIKTNPVHVNLWGNFITTPEVSNEKAVVRIETKVFNSTNQNNEIIVSIDIQNLQEKIVASSEKEIRTEALKDILVQQEIELANPELWNTETPNLYTAIVQLKKGKNIIDETKTKFGIRSIEFSPEKGFLLNGESVLLKGGCLHHDNGILGAAAFKTAEYRRVKIMKENGFNAIRCAHNPPSELFLNACDELGMLVMNESFDQWQLPKKPQDYNLYFDKWWEKDMESMVLRDRNHPSIIIWSVGNEIAERSDPAGEKIVQYLKAKVKELDTTRPVTQAVCVLWQLPGSKWEDNAPAFEHLDVHGYNYYWQKYNSDHEKYPERIIVGTESFPKEAFENWQLVEKYPYVIGDFVWTGMDYLGESGIGHNKLDNSDIQFLPPWPWFNSNCGDVSILGYKKPQMYFRDVVWRNSNLEMLVHAPIPEGRTEIVSMWGWPEEWKSWNWEGNENKTLLVSVYSRCEEVRLELDGKIIGTKTTSEEIKLPAQMEVPRESRKISALTTQFEVTYQPGELVAIGLIDGKEIVRQILKTTGKPARLKITAESETILVSGNDLVYFNVEVVDENGMLVPNAEIPVEFNIQGKCKLQAVGNGNPNDMKSFLQPRVTSFRGRCQLIVRSCEEENEIIVSAKSEGLKTGEAKVLLR
ncbi:MAG: glycoside hydrolase family 2 protein, partial [Prolixibacteraceae bacterium]|nr:glycoside hydrolase family 2 protein [Prolixibacteraceae bacterium]